MFIGHLHSFLNCLFHILCPLFCWVVHLFSLFFSVGSLSIKEICFMIHIANISSCLSSFFFLFLYSLFIYYSIFIEPTEKFLICINANIFSFMVPRQ